MQNRSNRGSGKPAIATAPRARAYDWDPTPRIALGPAAMYAAPKGRTHGSTRPACINVTKSLANRGPSTHAQHPSLHQRHKIILAEPSTHRRHRDQPSINVTKSLENKGAVHTWLRRLGTDIGRPTPPGPLSARKPIRFPWESGREPRVGFGSASRVDLNLILKGLEHEVLEVGERVLAPRAALGVEHDVASLEASRPLANREPSTHGSTRPACINVTKSLCQQGAVHTWQIPVVRQRGSCQQGSRPA